MDAGPRLSALQLAAALGLRAVVHTLVEYGADMNAPHVKGCALVPVVDKKHLEILQSILDKEIMWIAVNRGRKRSCMWQLLKKMWETCVCCLIMVRMLMLRGVDVEIAVQDALRVDNHDTVDKLQPLKKEKIIEGHDSNWRLSPRVVVPLESSMTAKGLSYCDATHRGNN